MTVETAFDGASQGFRLQYKGLMRGAADTIAARELELLWARSHHLCRNNPQAVTARNRLIAHWVGSGIKVQWDNKKMQKAWDEFIANPNLDGYGSLHNTMVSWAGGLFESGDIFTKMIISRRGSGTIPLKLQVIEAEQLDPRYNALGNIKNGIKFDSVGIPLDYYFWKYHPRSNLLAKVNTRVPTSADTVLHMFNRDRPGQWRGVPKLAPAMLAIYEMDELTDAALVRQKAAQAVGWIIKKHNTGAMPLLGNIETTSESLPKEEGDELGTKIQKILPGGVHYLEEDEDFEFASIDDIGSNFVSLLEHNWRMVASCLDVTYEQLSGDLSGANFSSIRAGLMEFRKRVALTQQLVFVNLGLIPLTEYFKELATVYINKEAGNSRCTFVFPKQEWVDPLKDAQADVLEIRAGLSTLKEKLAERGVEDVEKHIARLIEEQGYGVILSSNPKHEIKDKSKESSKADKD